jgi:uncharacterized damage-inducible protein DinB
LNARLNSLFTSLENERAALLGQMRTLTAGQFHDAPEGRWSVSQILAHIIAGERLSIHYLNKKMLGIDEAKNSGLTEEVKMLILKLSQRLPFKFKAPRVLVENTPSYQNLNDLISDWDTVRSELRATLERFRDDQINKKVYRHVRAGLMNIQHALLFFREHMIHHIPQIKQLLAAAHSKSM